MTKKEFKDWVDKTVREYNADFKALCLYRGETGEIIDENKIIVLDAKTGKTGMARCNPKDKFNFETGLAIAYARLRNIEIPKVEEEPNFGRVKNNKMYFSVEIVNGKGDWRRKTEDGDYCDVKYFDNNNYFHTQERAEEVADKINFLLKLERLHDIYCPDYVPDWENGEDKYYIFYNTATDGYGYRQARVKIESTVYFSTEKIAIDVCDELNKELEMPF